MCALSDCNESRGFVIQDLEAKHLEQATKERGRMHNAAPPIELVLGLGVDATLAQATYIDLVRGECAFIGRVANVPLVLFGS